MITEDPTTTKSLWLIDVDAKGNAKIKIQNTIENQSTKSIPLRKPYTLIFPDADRIIEKPELKVGISDSISLPVSNNEISTVIRGELEPLGSPNSIINFSIDIKSIQRFANIYDGAIVINRVLSESAFHSPDTLTIEFRFPNPKNIFKKLAVYFNHKPRGTEDDRDTKGFTIVRYSQRIDTNAIYPFLVDFMVRPKSNIAIIIALVMSIIGIILTLIFNMDGWNLIAGFILSILGGIFANYFTKKVLPD